MCLAREKQTGISTKPGLAATAWVGSAEEGLAEAGPECGPVSKPARGSVTYLVGFVARQSERRGLLPPCCQCDRSAGGC